MVANILPVNPNKTEYLLFNPKLSTIQIVALISYRTLSRQMCNDFNDNKIKYIKSSVLY